MLQLFGDLEAYSNKYFEIHHNTKAYANLIKSVDRQINIFDVDLETSMYKLIDTVLERKENAKLFYHNGGKFDYWFLKNILRKIAKTKQQYTLINIVQHNKQILKMTFKIKKRFRVNGKMKQKTYTIEFRDSYRVWPQALAKLAKSVGRRKLEIQDYDIIQEFKTNEDYIKYRNGEDWAYLNGDVDNLIHFHNATKNVIDIFKENITISRVSLKHIKRHNEELKFSTYWMKGRKDLWDEIKKSYSGGFTWVSPYFQLRILHSIYKYDVNSLYPYIMKIGKFPFGSASEDEGDWRYTYRYYRITATDIRALKIPFYSFKSTQEKDIDIIKDMLLVTENEKTHVEQHYPERVDKAEFTVNNYMLDFLQEHYEMKIIKKEFVCSFREKYGMFENFVQEWEDSKIAHDNDEAKRTIDKLVQNSGYGTLAEKPIRESYREVEYDWLIEQPLYRKTKKCELYDGKRILIQDGVYMIKEEQDIPKFKKANFYKLSYIPIADAITSKARIHLLKDIFKHDVWDRVVYTDTDSIHSTISLKDVLEIHPTKYGAWKFEGCVGTAVYRRPKHYLNTEILFNGKKTDYLIKGGGLDVGMFNTEIINGKPNPYYKSVTPQKYVQENLFIRFGKKISFICDGGVIIRNVDFNASMPAWWGWDE